MDITGEVVKNPKFVQQNWTEKCSTKKPSGHSSKGPVPLPKTHESREKNGQDLVVRDC